MELTTKSTEKEILLETYKKQVETAENTAFVKWSIVGSWMLGVVLFMVVAISTNH